MKDITKHPDYLYPHPVFKDEIFRKIPSSDKHEISNYGRIRVLGRRKKYNHPIVSRGKKYNYSLTGVRNPRILKARINRNGYVYVSGGRYKPHVLVLETFVCPRPYKKCVNHKDGNKLNNHISNLEWVTWSENMKHSWNNGLNRGRSKLNAGQVRFIRLSVKHKTHQQIELSKMFGVHPCTISAVVYYRNWKNV